MKPQLVLTSINTEHLTYENREHEAKGITKPEMKTKRHRNLDLSITPVGFGAWANCGSGWDRFALARINDAESKMLMLPPS
jgi:hypothetical protein